MEKITATLTGVLQSKRISHKHLLIAFLLIAFLLLLVLVGLIIYRQLYEKAVGDRPLVLIHAPEKSDYIQAGIDVIVHATARSENGIARIELWVNDALIAAEDTTEEEPLSLAVLNSNWLPIAPGPHTVVVRAVSVSGVRGQATLIVPVHEGPAGSSTDEGDSLAAAGAEAGETDEDSDAAPDSGGSAPSLGDDPPGSGDDLMDLIRDDSSEPELETSEEGGEPTGVKVEILALQTEESYEGLHCYVSFGSEDTLAQWYPDTDHDQSTDEDFPSSDGRNWEVEEYLSGGAVPTIMWPEDQALGIYITCVGTAGGGTMAPELGEVNLIRPPETWDGVPRQAPSEGGEGSYTVVYRITREGETPRSLIPIDLDPTMTPPTGLQIVEEILSEGFADERTEYRLEWDYEPREDEDPIEGFIIYMNDTLQWIERPYNRSTEIPSQWVQPPCGVAYAFKVSALIGDPVTGRESPPSNEVTRFSANAGEPGCEQQYLLTFHTLVTNSLDIGSINGDFWGAFYANREFLEFDGRCRGDGIVCGESRLSENWEYDLDRYMSSLAGEPAQFILTQGDESTFTIGYTIFTKYARFSERKERTAICYKRDTIGWGDILEVGHAIERRLGSEGPDDNFCQVYYTIEPIYTVGGPAAPSGEAVPLPSLRIAKLYVDEYDHFVIDLHNVGYADWTAQIPMHIVRNSGEMLEPFWVDVEPIAPGATREIYWNGFDPSMLPDICVILDPENVVAEQFEGDRPPRSTCFSYPNLSLNDAAYDTEDFEIEVQVMNEESRLDHYDLTVQITLPDGNFRDTVFTDLRSDEFFELEISSIPRDLRELMLDGYTITLDPHDEIHESNEEDNTFTIEPATRLRLEWVGIETFYYPYSDFSEDPQSQVFTLSLAKSPFEHEYRNPDLEHILIGELSESVEVDSVARSGPTEGEPLGRQEFSFSQSIDFTMAGDEHLFVKVLGSLEYGEYDPVFLGGGSRAGYDAWRDWGATRTIAEEHACHIEGDRFGLNDISVQPQRRWRDIGNWRVYYRICLIE